MDNGQGVAPGCVEAAPLALRKQHQIRQHLRAVAELLDAFVGISGHSPGALHHARMSRLSRWCILVAIPIALLVIFLLSVPFRQVEYYIDRHSGKWSATATWCGVLTLEHPVVNSNWHDPSLRALLTAEVRAIHLGHAVQRYAWSPLSRIRPDLPDAWYAEAFYHLFSGMSHITAANLPDTQRDTLLRERIARWNSTQLDQDPREIAEQAQAENAKISGRRAANLFVSP